MASFTRGDEQAWRALAMAARDPATAPDTLLARVRATAGRVIPCDKARDQSAFVAMQALARAAAQGGRARRRRLADCLSELAQDCAETAGWSLERMADSQPHAEPANVYALDLFAA